LAYDFMGFSPWALGFVASGPMKRQDVGGGAVCGGEKQLTSWWPGTKRKLIFITKLLSPIC
jgi:hypothetical protein